MKLAPMLSNDEDAKAETRGALNETCTDAQQEYGKDYAAQILIFLKIWHKFTHIFQNLS